MGVWKDKARKDWRYDFLYMGKRYAGGGLASRREALAAKEERKKEVRLAPVQEPTITVFSDIAKLYLDYSQRKHAAQTYEYKAYVCACFIKHHDDLPFEAITPQQIHEYLNTRPSNHNYNAHRKDLSAIWTFAKRQLGIDVPNPCQFLEKMPHTPKNKYVPPVDIISRLIEVADHETDEEDLLLCVIHTLGRIDEVLRMKWEDVNFEKNTITLWTRKRKSGAYEPNALPMGEDLQQILTARWAAMKQGLWVFFNEAANEGVGDRFYHRPKMMASLCKRAGIEPLGYSKRKVQRGKRKGEFEDHPLHLGFHSLRHFMASYFADQKKVGIKVVSGLLRHENLRTTEIYLHSIDEGQRVAIDKIQGKFTSKKGDSQASSTSIEEQGVTGNP